MDAKLQAKCDLFAENFKTVKSSAKLDAVEAAGLGALIYTNANAQANEAEIRKNRSLLHDKVSVANNLRGQVSIALLCKMSLVQDPQNYLDKIINAYNLLKQGHMYHDEYEALAATAIVDFAEPAQHEDIAARTQAIIKKMHEVHPILTNTEDTTVAALLAMSDLDIETTLAAAEECYEILKDDHFTWAKDALQSVCMILALSEQPVQEKCKRFHDIRQAIKDSDGYMSADHLAIIAALVDTDASPTQIASEIKEVETYLKGKRGFGGIFGIGKQMRLVFSAAIILQAKNEEMGRAGIAQAASNALATVITEQIIMAIITFIIMSSFIVHNTTIYTSS